MTVNNNKDFKSIQPQLWPNHIPSDLDLKNRTLASTLPDDAAKKHQKKTKSAFLTKWLFKQKLFKDLFLSIFV